MIDPVDDMKDVATAEGRAPLSAGRRLGDRADHRRDDAGAPHAVPPHPRFPLRRRPGHAASGEILPRQRRSRRATSSARSRRSSSRAMAPGRSSARRTSPRRCRSNTTSFSSARCSVISTPGCSSARSTFSSTASPPGYFGDDPAWPLHRDGCVGRAHRSARHRAAHRRHVRPYRIFLCRAGAHPLRRELRRCIQRPSWVDRADRTPHARTTARATRNAPGTITRTR